MNTALLPEEQRSQRIFSFRLKQPLTVFRQVKVDFWWVMQTSTSCSCWFVGECVQWMLVARVPQVFTQFRYHSSDRYFLPRWWHFIDITKRDEAFSSLIFNTVNCLQLFLLLYHGVSTAQVIYEGHLESKERFAIQRYLLTIGKKQNMQVLSHTFTYFST